MMMLAMEEVLCELSDHEKKNEQGLPPGFRFHPTDEELITFYLASKVFNYNNGSNCSSFSSTSNVKFAEVDLNRCEPWELPEVAKMGEREWYLFSLRDRKYPTGLRTNRATGAGYWKATGKDKQVYSNGGEGALLLIGMKKTLVFYKGRAPRGEKTKWVMHEYRLDGHFSHSHTHHNTCNNKEEWVICRIFHKCGEKRASQLLQQLQASDPKKACLLAATPTSSFITLGLNDLRSSHSHSHHDLFPLHDAFQPNSFPIAAAAAAATNTHTQGLFFKSHLSQQQTIPKTEATFYEHQSLLDSNNMRWMDNNSTSTNDFQNSFPLDQMDAAAGMMMAFSGGAAAAPNAAHEFNRIGGLDAPMIGSIDSWPQPQLV